MKFFLFFLFFLISCFCQSQDPDSALIHPGKYGSYADVSSYTELILMDDHTFSYTDRFELGSTVTLSGKWKTEGKYLVLYDFENSKSRPMPVKWLLNNDQLCGKVNRKFQSCLKKAD